MFRPTIIAIIAGFLMHAATGRVSADILQHESLDLAVANSDLVVRGEVVDLVTRDGEMGTVFNQVTLRVTETVKGEKLKEVKFLVTEYLWGPKGGAWRNKKEEILVCLSAQKAPAGGFRVDFELRAATWMHWAVPMSGVVKMGLPVYSVQFKALTDPKAILQAAHAAAADKHVKKGATGGWVPPDGPELSLRAHMVLYPMSDRVGEAAKRHGIKLFP